PGRGRRLLLRGGGGGGLRLGVLGSGAAGGDVGLLRLLRLLGLLLLVEARVLLRHAAPSFRSSSTISASTTSSSALVSPAPAEAPPAACAPWASAYMAWPSFWETAATFSVAVRISAVSSPLSFSFSSVTAASTSVLISPGTLSWLSARNFSVW